VFTGGLYSTRMSSYPQGVGISAIEVYIPYNCVDQAQLEKHDGASAGKYTIGLGQTKMSFCGDQEDINSLCLTVVQKLIEREGIDLKDVGRLDVGTETIIDKSKSVKSVLMQLFEPSGNTDIEGLDTTNACFGGTAALLNAINWMESSSWDGRKALVVVGDIALYASGPARPTGGCGAIAMLVTPDAPLVIDRGMRAFHMSHVYDFYKPNMSSEYPVIDGQLSIKCFLSALDNCYRRYKEKAVKQLNEPMSVTQLDYILFHTPFCKMTRKALARLYLTDYLNKTAGESGEETSDDDPLGKFKGMSLESTFTDAALFREVEKASVSCSGEVFTQKTLPSQLLPTNTGNTYTASLYSCLISLLVNVSEDELLGKRVALFSYGSGLASCMFSLTICADGSTEGSVKLRRLVDSLSNMKERLASRKEVEPTKFVEMIESRENIHKNKDEEFVPVGCADDLFPGTYYVTKIDTKARRTYKRKAVGEPACIKK